jgi:hypothetical protein
VGGTREGAADDAHPITVRCLSGPCNRGILPRRGAGGGAELYDDLIGAVEDPDRSDALSIVASAGNQGPARVGGATWGAMRIPNGAKNTIVVGSISSDLLGLPPRNQLVGTSSRGPTDDGRLKPEVVAPGT